MTIAIRPAVVEDATWMAPLLREGAREGHFLDTVGFQADPLLHSLLNFGGLTMRKLRRGREEVCTVHGYVWVATVDNEPAAFLICMDDQEGYELHLAGTRSEYLRRGCFKALVGHAIANAPSEGRVFARCYPRSTVAVDALRRYGFVPSSSGDPMELDLKRPAPTPPAPEPVPLSWWQRFLEGKKRTD